MAGLDAETRALVAQTLERFVAERYDAASRLVRLKSRPVNYRQQWPFLAELGVPAFGIAADDGGMGAEVADVCRALQALAPGLVLEPVIENYLGTLLLSAGSVGRPEPLEAAASGECISVVVGLPGWSAPLQLQPAGAHWLVRGHVKAVPFATQADEWLVAAMAGDGPRVLRIPSDWQGVSCSSFRLMDGRPAADMEFVDCVVGPAQEWLIGDSAVVALQRASDCALAAHAADAVGVMDHLLKLTRDYLRTRVQFGVAIATFQALQHRLADMHMLFLEARALLRTWVEALEAAADAAPRNRLRPALIHAVGRAGRRLGQEAIQMHGGMGVTEELAVSHCNARLQVIATMLSGYAGAHAWRQ